MTLTRELNVREEVASITAQLKERRDLSYEWGMRMVVPSQQPAHAVRVPEIRRVAVSWSREHRGISAEELLKLAEALWATGWREERRAAIAILGRSKPALAQLSWDIIERWTAGIDNWELVDAMAGELTGPMLVAQPELIAGVQAASESAHVWHRRLAIVTLIMAARVDRGLLPHLQAMAEGLRADRGPTMRKAVDWARRAALRLEATA